MSNNSTYSNTCQLSSDLYSLGHPQAVLFDWDQTLVDNWTLFFQAINKTLIHFGHTPWSEQETRLRVGCSARQAFEKLFDEQVSEASSFYYNYINKHHLEALKPTQGAKKVLDIIYRQKIPAAVVSNKRGPILRKEIAYLGWDHYFMHNVGAGDTEFDKPHAGPAFHALNCLGIKQSINQPIWFIGDHPVDTECAYHSGCLSILVNHQKHHREAFGDYPPIFQFASLSVLADLVVENF